MSIFVTGATGTTGSEAVKALQATGAKIRIGARNPDKAKSLAGPNTDIVPFDFDKTETYGALKGSYKLYLCTGFDPKAHDQAIALIDAAVVHGVQHVVKLSALGADSVPGVVPGRWHRTVERYLMGSGMAWTILRPSAFMSNFAHFWGATIKSENKFYLPLGSGKIGWVDPRDVGASAAKVLTSVGHAGKAYTLTGAEALDANQAAKGLSEGLGRTIAYVDIPESAAIEGMKKHGMPEWAVSGMMELYAIWKNGYGATATRDVEVLTGRKPYTFAQYAKTYAPLFK